MFSWDFSSYHELIADVPARLQRQEVMDLFAGRNDFVRNHEEIQPLVVLDEEE